MWLAASLMARKPAFLHIFEVNRTIRRCLFSDLGQNLCHFFPILIIIPQVVKEYNLTKQIALIQQQQQHKLYLHDYNYVVTVLQKL